MIQQKYKEILDFLDEELLEFNIINNKLRNYANWLQLQNNSEIQLQGKQIQLLIQQIDQFLDKISMTYQQHLQFLKSVEQLSEKTSYSPNKYLDHLLINLININELINSFDTKTSMIRNEMEKQKQQIIKEIEEIKKQFYI